MTYTSDLTPERADLLRQRYGRDHQPAILWNRQIEDLLAHRSQRAFLPDPVTEQELATIVAGAQSASTSSNQHLWSVVAISDRDTLEQLAAYTRGPSMKGKGYDFVAAAPMVLLWVADMSRNQAIVEREGADHHAIDFLDAFTMATIDTALAAQNGLVAAESIGLGGVYLGSMRNQSQALADLIGLPDYAYVAFGMAIGRPDPEHASSMRPRPPQSVVLHREAYDNDQGTGWIDDYEDAFQEFRTDAGLRDKTWVEATVFAASPDYMDGREHLRRTVTSRGFALQ
ncbi:nitroreductase family protein [Brachybacterium kimchii]|uniref:Nitroreductase family protein n=1 Tax=Brachybacterium kimchii TaxID=2942909 RepID=A0ABY4N9D8_9MICO|nr:nitroreductase family protein [Brachybacterium kimchii]UQN31137.1 nitroreductase family protein [Brachybacterium kimchii]